MNRARAVTLTRIGVLAALVMVLEALCRTRVISPLSVIPPSQMAASMIGLLASGEITQDIVRTFSEVAVAFAGSVGAGFLLGVLLHAWPRGRRVVDPLLASYYAVPFFVFYPLLVALFGLNAWPLIAIGFVFATPAMLMATLLGLDRVPPVLLKTARVLRLGRFETVRLVVLPAALPALLGGVKLALAYAFIGVIAGEFILAGGGLGYAIAYAYEGFENATMYGLMLFVLLTAVIANALLYAWEARTLRRRARA